VKNYKRLDYLKKERNMTEILEKEEKKQKIKALLKILHEGKRIDEVKEEFKDILKSIHPEDITAIEEELIREGMPREEVQRLCDVHIALFKESLEEESTIATKGHPINTLMEEHKILLQFAAELLDNAKTFKQFTNFDSAKSSISQLGDIIEHLKEAEKHYLREENVLFPYLEKHGITQPPAIMWTEHNEIREIKKKLYELMDSHESINYSDFCEKFGIIASSLEDKLRAHFYKENKILFPTALKVITEDEWVIARKDFDEIGYCCFTPVYARESIHKESEIITKPMKGAEVSLETGNLSLDQLESILNTLPIDITFIDKNDIVQYFSLSKDRIFPRTKAVIGRSVQLCHPQKSLNKVEQILDDFKNNRRDVAEFWINLNNKLIYIRYFAVRKNGEYLGTLEVTQDITDIKRIEGEKRLL